MKWSDTELPPTLLELAESLFGPCREVRPVAGAASSRRYWRTVCEKGSCVATWGEDLAENKAFIALSAFFLSLGLHVPRVYAVTDDGHGYLQRDLGSVSLYDVLSRWHKSGGHVVGHTASDAYGWAEKTLRMLPLFQLPPGNAWKEAVFNPPFEGDEVYDDLEYCRNFFIKASGFEGDVHALRRDFRKLVEEVDSLPGSLRGLMLRDVQSRNVMLDDGAAWFIDFQGARPGPCIYDAVSFLWQARARFSPDWRKKLVLMYADVFLARLEALHPEMAPRREALRASLLGAVPCIVLLRTLQTLGAYGFRGLVEHKADFAASLPQALNNLVMLLEDPCSVGCPGGWKESPSEAYPALCGAIAAIAGSGRYAMPAADGGLVVRVCSFSYKKGYPQDLTGNGGGFVFDCRAMHNPGRYEQYKSLTGRDPEVVEFLEQRGEVQRFVDNALAMASPSVERYQQRGFTSLQIGFGCTGGQHRSVYCADRFAHLLAERFPGVRVECMHREQSF